MWTPPSDQVESVDTGWKPPASEVETIPSSNGSSQFGVAKFAAGVASNLAPWNRITSMRQNLGGDIAEAGGYVGGKVANAGFPQAGNVIQGAGVGLGAVPAIGPEVLAAYTSLKGLYNPRNPVAAGITNSPKDLSPQYTAQNQAIGISNDAPEMASKTVNPDPYQYSSQLSKPKYIPGADNPDLPIVQPGAKTGDPHALFAYNDQFGPGGSQRAIYNVFGDPSHPALQARGWGSSISAEDAEAAGIPITGRQPNSVTYQPIENPNAPAFSRPKPQTPAESLPSTTPLKYSDDPATLINQINSRIDTHGINLNPQELQDYKEILSTKMNPQTGEIPKGTPLYAKATQAEQKVTSTLNQVVDPLLKKAQLSPNVIPSRTGLNKATAISHLPAKVLSGLATAGKYGAEGVAGLGAIYGAYQGLKRLGGGQ